MPSILEQVYANKNKVAGVNIDDPQEKERIYQRYLQAFKKGAYNYIKEEQDPQTRQVVSRKYFSGGVTFLDMAMMTETNLLPVNDNSFAGDFLKMTADVRPWFGDQAMLTDLHEIKERKKGGRNLLEILEELKAKGTAYKQWKQKYIFNTNPKRIKYALAPLVIKGDDTLISIKLIAMTSSGDPRNSDAIEQILENIRSFWEGGEALREWADQRQGQKVEETQAGLGKRFGLSQSTVSEILAKYEITTAGKESEGGKALREWADPRQGQKVKKTQEDLGKKFGLSGGTVSRILAKYEITTAGNESKRGNALREWADQRQGQKVEETQEGLGKKFGLTVRTVSKILAKYEITTAGNESKRGKALREWADPRRGQKVERTQADLGKQFGLFQPTVSKILAKYKITTAGNDSWEGGKALREWANPRRGQKVERTQEDLGKKFGLSGGTVSRILAKYEITTAGNESEEGKGWTGRKKLILIGDSPAEVYLKRIGENLRYEALKTPFANFIEFHRLSLGKLTDEEVRQILINNYDVKIIDRPMVNGGIDFNSNKMNLQLQNGGKEIKFHMNPAMLAQLQNASGFVPVIINIQPLKDLQQFFGNNSTAPIVPARA